jgi:hypothetical protein
MTAQVPYRFERFTRQLLFHDLRFEGGPGPGERFPDFDLHRQLDPKPHAAYLVGTDGTVRWRTLWANDEPALEEALEAVAEGERPAREEVQPLLLPMLGGTGEMWEVWDAAGGHAKTDVLRQVPPVYLSGRLAHLLRPLPPVARGALGMTLAMGVVIAAGLGLRAALREGRGT